MYWTKLQLQPVLNHGAAFGGEYAFGVELYAVDVHGAMAEGHDLTFVADGGYLQALGELLAADYPRVVAAHGDALGEACEDGVDAHLGAFSGYAMENVGEVLQLSAE